MARIMMTIAAFGLFMYVILTIMISISRGIDPYWLGVPVAVMGGSLAPHFRFKKPTSIVMGSISAFVCATTLLILKFTFFPQMAAAGSEMSDPQLINMEYLSSMEQLTYALGLCLLAVGVLLALRAISQFKKMVENRDEPDKKPWE